MRFTFKHLIIGVFALLAGVALGTMARGDNPAQAKATGVYRPV